MRLAILTAGLSFSLCAIPALCQQGLANPAQPQISQPTFQFPGKDFSHTPPVWQNSSLPQTHVVIMPPAHDLHAPMKMQIDPGIVIHPAKSHTGDQQEGSLVAQNLYPGLRMLPIGATATGKYIPTDWPKGKGEPIPITWPNARALPIDSNNAATNPPPAK